MVSKFQIKTHLLSGAGNLFHIIYNSHLLDPLIQKQVAKEFCQIFKADGFIFLYQSSNLSKEFYQWNFYNNDGSVAEMCGNATRCVGFYIRDLLNIHLNQIILKTGAGSVRILENNTVIMTPLILNTHQNFFYCNTGVPHIVLSIDNFDGISGLKSYCQNLRNHSSFAPQGTNVTLICQTDELSLLKAITYERGVEDFTAACGTGAMAAAYYNLITNNQITTRVQMPGGELFMDLSDLKNPRMTGPVELIGEFQNEFKI